MYKEKKFVICYIMQYNNPNKVGKLWKIFSQKKLTHCSKYCPPPSPQKTYYSKTIFYKTQLVCSNSNVGSSEAGLDKIKIVRTNLPKPRLI